MHACKNSVSFYNPQLKFRHAVIERCLVVLAVGNVYNARYKSRTGLITRSCKQQSFIITSSLARIGLLSPTNHNQGDHDSSENDNNNQW